MVKLNVANGQTRIQFTTLSTSEIFSTPSKTKQTMASSISPLAPKILEKQTNVSSFSSEPPKNLENQTPLPISLSAVSPKKQQNLLSTSSLPTIGAQKKCCRKKR